MEEDGVGVTGGPDLLNSPVNITVHVKFGGRTLLLSLSPDSTLRDLKSLLQPLTNVLPRGQKLIFKGKVLVDTMTLKSSQVTNGSKVMLIASHGVHQGDGPITKDATSTLSKSRSSLDATQKHVNRTMVTVDKGRSERWRLTGVVALSECHLKKLFLNANVLLDEEINWEGLSSLKSLTVLSLNKNNLVTLPSGIGGLTSLTQLHIANNKLTNLPVELGFLNQLQILKVNNNRISSVPSDIGKCCSLIEIDLSSNLLVGLPETFGNLRNLKALYINNNGLKSLPSTMFKMCSQLSTLDLHGTEITNDILRQSEGWEAFDERRRLKHQKQLDFRAGSSGIFDEGADDDRRP